MRANAEVDIERQVDQAVFSLEVRADIMVLRVGWRTSMLN
jgi:hypothetical protein